MGLPHQASLGAPKVYPHKFMGVSFLAVGFKGGCDGVTPSLAYGWSLKIYPHNFMGVDSRLLGHRHGGYPITVRMFWVALGASFCPSWGETGAWGFPSSGIVFRLRGHTFY